jgi:hypothetical protein
MFTFLFLFTVISASAQSTFGTDVEIPFAFNVGDHSYEAGNYILKLEKLPTGAAMLAIRDTKTDELQTVIVNANGEATGTEIKLVFDTVEGRRYLTKIRTPDRSYSLIKSKAEKNAAKAVRDAERVVGS